MKVILKDSVYEMTRAQLDGVLDAAVKSMDSGIYAIEMDETVEMKNEQYIDPVALRKAVRGYEEMGFKVYWKGREKMDFIKKAKQLTLAECKRNFPEYRYAVVAVLDEAPVTLCQTIEDALDERKRMFDGAGPICKIVDMWLM